jgi:hypothetical protein
LAARYASPFGCCFYTLDSASQLRLDPTWRSRVADEDRIPSVDDSKAQTVAAINRRKFGTSAAWSRDFKNSAAETIWPPVSRLPPPPMAIERELLERQMIHLFMELKFNSRCLSQKCFTRLSMRLRHGFRCQPEVSGLYFINNLLNRYV